MKKYELSVIIPVHNTDLELFSNCIASLVNQEIGFENIELIAVLHNCNTETIEGARKILAPSDNVILTELNNDIHSPSSPRNYGIDHATGDYLTFLDSDDVLTPECLRLSLEYVKRADADICHFRKKVLLEKEGEIVFNELVLWDQTKELIALKKEELDHKRYFVGAWGMSTGKLFRRQLLIDNHIRFDESIKFAEDYHFMLNVFGQVETICLAPQLIGYVYCVNGQSLVQTIKITQELLLEYVEGFQKVFDKGLENNIYMNDTMASVMLIILNWMQSCKDLTNEGRAKIKELMGPYVRMLEPINPSKLYPLGKSDRMNTFLIKYILREEPKPDTYIARADEGTGNTFMDRQKDALLRILRNGQNSDYSRRYGFSGIKTIEEYQKRLPVSDYELYKPMIRLTTQMGERGIFTDNEITSYVLAKESEKEQKRLPVTYKSIEPYVKALRKSIGATKTFLLSEALPFEASRLTMDYKYTNNVFGVALKQYIAEAEDFGSGYATFTTPKEYLFPVKPQDMKCDRLAFALKERDLETIFSPDPDTLKRRFQELESNVKRVLEIVGESDRERADELSKLFSSKDKPTLRTIWPSLKKIVCWNMTCDIAAESIKPWIRDMNVDISCGYMYDEYALYGEIINNGGEVILAPDHAFYEFLPMTEAAGQLPYTAANITEGEYKLLVSNLSGLYRYDTGLHIKCISKDQQKIFIRII